MITNVKGAIDSVHNGQCYGWALDEAAPGFIEIRLFIDGELAGSTMANLYREDLAAAGLRDGRVAFCFDIPETMRDGRHHRIELFTTDGKRIACREAIQVVPRLTPTEFDRRAPWVDANDKQFEEKLTTLKQMSIIDAEMETKLRFFREHGYLILEQAVPHELIDKALSDVEAAWHDLPATLVLNNKLTSPVLMSEVAQTPDFRTSSFRYLDFHNVSEACAEIMMIRPALDFIKLYFESEVAAMQTLLFENGTQQDSHQDFAFVHSLRPACLAGAWVALEDVHEDAGPLFYWDKSHRQVPKYVFADGSVLAEGDGPHVRAFETYLEQTCRTLGLKRLVFKPRKGDLLIWSSALVHGGMPRNDPALTRKSIVSHYTTQEAYPYDRRRPNAKTIICERNGGIYYGARREGHVEGRYKI